MAVGMPPRRARRRLALLALAATSIVISRLVHAAAEPLQSTAVGLAAPRRAMKLDEALAYARSHHPAVKSALARVAAAAADTRIPRAQWLPTVVATLQGLEATANNTTASYLGVRGVDVPRIGGTRVDAGRDWTPHLSTFAAVGATQELFDFGRIATQATLTDLTYQAEGLRADAERLRLNLAVKEAYYGVLGARAVARAADEARQRATAHRDLAAANVRSGLRPPIELTRADADLARFEVAAVRALGAVRSAQAVFAAATGVDEALLDASGQPGPLGHLPSLREVVDQAAARDPVLREARTRAQAADAAITAIAAETRPSLALTGTFSERGGAAPPSTEPLAATPGGLPTFPNWDLGVVLRWPLLDPLVNARRDAAAARAQVARAQLEALLQEHAADLLQTYVSLEVAVAALAGFQHAVEASHANYAQADARFRAGLGTSLELADAEGVRTDAEIQLAVGEFGAHRYRAVLARLIGEDP